MTLPPGLLRPQAPRSASHLSAPAITEGPSCLLVLDLDTDATDSDLVTSDGSLDRYTSRFLLDELTELVRIREQER